MRDAANKKKSVTVHEVKEKDIAYDQEEIKKD